MSLLWQILRHEGWMIASFLLACYYLSHITLHVARVKNKLFSDRIIDLLNQHHLTGRRSCKKFKCLCENPMANIFFRN